jgi:hypothetical protein
MTTLAPARTRKSLTFEDLKGLRAEVYVRDSTLDQRNGFGRISSTAMPKGLPRCTG